MALRECLEINWFKKVNLSCRQAAHLISQRQDRELSLGERAALQIHVAICRGCRAFSGQIDCLRRALRRLSDRDR